MKHAIGLAISLIVVWLLWSGHYDPFLLTLGAFSVAVVMLLCFRMSILDGEAVPLDLKPSLLTSYLPWLMKEIVVANWDVTKRILQKEMPIRPRLLEIVPQQKSDLGRVIFANSITLTPGTVSVELQNDLIRVHALSAADAEDDQAGDMNERVARLER